MPLLGPRGMILPIFRWLKLAIGQKIIRCAIRATAFPARGADGLWGRYLALPGGFCARITSSIGHTKAPTIMMAVQIMPVSQAVDRRPGTANQ